MVPPPAGHPGAVNKSHVAAHERVRPLRLRHRAVPEELRAIRRRVERWAGLWDLPVDTVVDLQLALGEAVANGVEHAYPADRPGTVEVELEVRGAGGTDPVVVVRVADHGRWRPAPERAGHRGRGLLMINRLARLVEVRPSAHGTRVCFEIPLAG